MQKYIQYDEVFRYMHKYEFETQKIAENEKNYEKQN